MDQSPVNGERSRRRVTIRDVARAAGVSSATVSYVLNGRTDQVAPATRDRVAQVMRDLGFHPSVSARQLRGKRVRSLGLLIHSLVNPASTMLVRGVEHTAAAHGYSLILADLDRMVERAVPAVDALAAGRVDGVALAVYDHREVDLAAHLAKRGLACVAFSSWPERLGIPTVGIDHDPSIAALLDHLLALGHRRLGFLTHAFASDHALRRLDALQRAAAERGLDPPTVVHVDFPDGPSRWPEDYQLQIGREAARQLASLPHPPTAVVASHDVLALGFMDGARALGWRIPDDVAVVGFDDIPFSAVATPPLTTLRLPMYAIGQTLVEMLLARLAGETPPSRLITPQLVVRGSTAPPGGSPEAPWRSAPEPAPSKT